MRHSYWWRAHPSGSRRRWLAERLRWVADCIGPEDSFGKMTSVSLSLKDHKGWVVVPGGQGLPIYTRQCDRDRTYCDCCE